MKFQMSRSKTQIYSIRFNFSVANRWYTVSSLRPMESVWNSNP